MTLAELGWGDAFEAHFGPYAKEGLEPGRVVCELRRNFYAVRTVSDEVLAECGGGFFHSARTPDQFPAIGDWVAVKTRVGGAMRADIHGVLPRMTKFSRRAAGSEEIEQIIAANVDTVFLVSGLDRNFNPRRIQRFLVAARASGAEAVIILNKADLCDDAEAVRDEVVTLVPGVPVLLTSYATRKGLKGLVTKYALPGRTLAFIGSSGVGKSSLINALVRDAELPTAEVRDKDSKGRHTTTRRELIMMPSGAMVIDTPGMRELQLWGIDEGVDDAFPDIKSLAETCRFGNCGHSNEPGCAIRAAIASGALPQSRFDAYQKLKAEQLAQRPVARRPGALASKPGWKRKAEGLKPFRQRDYEE